MRGLVSVISRVACGISANADLSFGTMNLFRAPRPHPGP
jgi:hypothetical protein